MSGPQAWDGDAYQARFDALAAQGASVHGEVDLIVSFPQGSVLDAGCGTGRVAIELDRRGWEVVGVDVDASMVATARRLAPHLTWLEADLTTLDLGRTFDLVVLAGNVPLFTPAGTQRALLVATGTHVAAGGHLVVGFSLGHGYELDALDDDAGHAQLDLVARYASWDGQPFTEGADYAVSVFARP